MTIDPRERRRRPMAGAVHLELAAEEMRAQLLTAGPSVSPTVEVPPPGVFGAVEVPLVLEQQTPAPAVPAPAGAVAERSEPNTPALTWRSFHDERSRAFAVDARRAVLQDYSLHVGPVLDQGTEGACVGAATANAVNSLELQPGQARRVGFLTMRDAHELYHLAQQLDDRPGEDYTGTSVLAGMKAAQRLGWISAYRWCFGTRQILDSVIGGRPVVVGIPWYSGMYTTAPGGLVQVSGAVVGGHCLEVAAVRRSGPQGQAGPFFGWYNSWGPSYGVSGWGWVHHRTLTMLLAGSGEAAVPVL